MPSITHVGGDEVNAPNSRPDGHEASRLEKTSENGEFLQPQKHSLLRDTESLSGNTLAHTAPPVRRLDEYDVNFE